MKKKLTNFSFFPLVHIMQTDPKKKCLEMIQEAKTQLCFALVLKSQPLRHTTIQSTDISYFMICKTQEVEYK